jgi:Ca2+-binding RTX toxin-like protein
MTRDGAGQVNVYANGAPRISYDDSVQGVGALLDNAIVFFRDNGGEESAGAVARIRVYDDALSPAEVLAPPACPQAPQSSPCAGKQATIAGTPGNDKLTGTPRRDVIVALGGKDRVSGGKGNDLICGGAGRDILKGGKGKDKLKGGSGKDTVLGQKGKDKLKGGSGKDLCKGGKGKDTASKCEVEKSI